jgi:hypothetical protein
MNFYRIPRAEFDDNYMIRLVKHHFLFPKTTYRNRNQVGTLPFIQKRGAARVNLANQTNKIPLAGLVKRANMSHTAYEVRGKFFRSAKFYSTLTSELLYHGITHYNRRRYKRLRLQKNLLTYLRKKLTVDELTSNNKL